MERFLLDTHILLWWFEEERKLPKTVMHALNTASEKRSLLLSDISLWEISVLHELGRVKLSMPLAEWLAAASAPPLIEIVPISPAIAADSSRLPDSVQRDPADRIIISSARVRGATLLTCDRRIKESGVVKVKP